MRIFVLYLLLSFLFPLNLFAKFDNLHFRNISIDDGLSDKLVLSIEKDRYGFLWIGTSEGLNRYDGYTFDVYKYSPQYISSLSSSFINDIHEDEDGVLWIGTEKGLQIYDRDNDSFKEYEAINDTLNLMQNLRIRSIHDVGGVVYLGTLDGLVKVDKASRYISYFKLCPSDYNKMANEVICITHDRYGMIWLGSYDGLYRYNPMDNSFTRFEARHKRRGDITNNLINALYIEENSDFLYIGGASGLIVYDVTNPGIEVQSLRVSEGSLVNSEIKTITKYKEGILLLGTVNGVSLYDIKTKQDKIFRSSLYDSTSLPSNHIRTSYYDGQNGMIWLGTENGLAQLDMRRKQVDFIKMTSSDDYGALHNFFAYDLSCQNGDIWLASNEGVTKRTNGCERIYTIEDGLSHKVCKCLLRDSYGTLWTGTNNGLNVYDKNTDRFDKVNLDSCKTPLKYIFSIVEDSDHDIVTNVSSGIVFISPKRDVGNRITDIDYKVVSIGEMIKSDNCDIGYIESDGCGGIWFSATMEGLFYYDKTNGSIVNFRASGANDDILSDRIYSIHADINHDIWIGTDVGLCCYRRETGKFEHFDDGDLMQSVRMITSDDSGRIWFTTVNKLIMFDVKTNEKIICDLYSDFGFDEVTWNSSAHDTDGNIYIGVDGGYICFDPKNITVNDYDAPLRIKSMFLMNEEVRPGRFYDGRILTSTSMPDTKRIVLGYKQNSFSFVFSLLNYSSSTNRYLYRLDGYDAQWNTADLTANSASYSNLPPGKYKFHVRACNSDNIWSSTEPIVDIVITKPIMLRWYAKLFYVLISCLAIWMVINFFRARMRLADELKSEKMERQKLEELNDAKMRFFTNVSHDFKTPLSLILGPLENLMATARDDRQLSQLKILQSNANMLLRLINQIIDIRKIDKGQLTLNLKNGDIVSFSRDVFEMFRLSAAENSISYNFQSSEKQLLMKFDSDKIEKILYNLISNAMKFTPAGGAVSVQLGTVISDNKHYASISVIDTGRGLSYEEKMHIFERFYQGESQKSHRIQGSGIGLNIVKDFVEIHGGSISVDSEIGKGCRFTFIIPTGSDRLKQFNIDNPETEVSSDPDTSILVVEDNSDMREFLKDTLKDKYEVHVVSDGYEGYLTACEIVPDLILTDVMMPKRDGYELCRKIKSEMFTSHIPVILLTAKSDEESRTEAYNVGADGYLTKPFSIKTLSAKIAMLLEQRKKLQDKFRLDLMMNPSLAKSDSENDRFINLIVETIENNIDNSEFGIHDLCVVTKLPYQQIYRKVRAMTGESINEFIRSIRLKHAARLLSEHNMRVSEITYAVGFNSHSYFTKCFKEKYGVSPREYADNQ